MGGYTILTLELLEIGESILNRTDIITNSGYKINNVYFEVLDKELVMTSFSIRYTLSILAKTFMFWDQINESKEKEHELINIRFLKALFPDLSADIESELKKYEKIKNIVKEL